jgi:hypothetical protein
LHDTALGGNDIIIIIATAIIENTAAVIAIDYGLFYNDRVFTVILGK